MTTKFTLLTWIECTRADCSLPWFTTKGQLMVPWPHEESRILATIRPFQFKVLLQLSFLIQRFFIPVFYLQVWLLLPISMICVMLTIIYLPKFYKESNITIQGKTYGLLLSTF